MYIKKPIVYHNKIGSWGELWSNNTHTHTYRGRPSEIPVAPVVYAMTAQPVHSCSTLCCGSAHVNTSFNTMTTESKGTFPHFMPLTGGNGICQELSIVSAEPFQPGGVFGVPE